MFSTSFGLLLAHLGLYIILPAIPGIIATWIIGGDRMRGWLFYILSWFIGVGVLGYGLFLLQFVRFGIDWIAYAILIVFLAIILAIRMKITDLSCRDLMKTLKCSWKIYSFKDMSKWQKISTILLIIYIALFVLAGLYVVTNFPSYADDAFGNWHAPLINILYDGGVHMFGDKGEILGRARLGYPIMIPLGQAFISNVIGGYNDIYVNIFPWLSLVMFLKFIVIYVYQKRNNLRDALIGPALIISLPLVFIHMTQGYMDMLSAIYTALAVLSLYEWLREDGKKSDLFIGVALLAILSYVKNDGFVVYMTGVVIALVIYFLLHRKDAAEKLHVFKKPMTWLMIGAIILFFIVPFTFIKSYYGLGFNQAAGADAGLGLASTIHWEIFPALWKTIWSMNNFSVAPLLLFVLLIGAAVHWKQLKKEKIFLLLIPVVLIGIFLAVFLFTENYKFVLDQTTSNRVFTMVLVIFFSSIVLVLHDTTGKKHMA